MRQRLALLLRVRTNLRLLEHRVLEGRRIDKLDSSWTSHGNRCRIVVLLLVHRRHWLLLATFAISLHVGLLLISLRCWLDELDGDGWGLEHGVHRELRLLKSHLLLAKSLLMVALTCPSMDRPLLMTLDWLGIALLAVRDISFILFIIRVLLPREAL